MCLSHPINDNFVCASSFCSSGELPFFADGIRLLATHMLPRTEHYQLTDPHNLIRCTTHIHSEEKDHVL